MTSDENTKTDPSETAATAPPIPNGHGTNGAHAPADDRATTDAPSVKKRKKVKPQAKAAAPAPQTVPQEPASTQDPASAESPPPPPPTEPGEQSAPTPDAVSAVSGPMPGDAAPEPAREGLRLRMKVWTDPQTSKRYLMPTAFMQDVKNGRPVSDVMRAYAMSEEDTKVVTLRAHEWNALPFYYFQEDGPAPRASARPPDVVTPEESAT